MTSGWRLGTTGKPEAAAIERRFRFPAVFWWCYGAALAVFAAVTATSYWMEEAAHVGRPTDILPFTLNEATSVALVFALTPVVLRWTASLDPARIGWPRTIAGHLGGAAAFAAIHVLGMVGLRMAIYPLLGQTYPFGSIVSRMVYEGRKDALAYAAMVLLAWLLDRALRTRSRPAAPAAASPDRRIEIRDGSQQVWLEPPDVLWVQAAGNYVEFHTAERSWLARRTLVQVEQELAELGFVRIHRSRLVNARRVRAAESRQNGDYVLTLDTGTQVGGGRRWRDALSSLSERR